MRLTVGAVQRLLRILLYFSLCCCPACAHSQNATILAAVNDVEIEVMPVWNCRSQKTPDCFAGFWLDLTAAGVAGNTNYTLTVVLPDMAPVRPCRLSSLLLRQLLNERGSD